MGFGGLDRSVYAVGLALALEACHDWDGLDPRLSSGGGSGGSGGPGGSGAGTAETTNVGGGSEDVRLQAVADTYANEDVNMVGTSFGSASVMKTDGNGSGVKRKRSFVQFDLSSIPDGVTIRGADLTLCFTKVGMSDGRTHDLHKVVEGWTEAELVWTAQPAVDEDISSSIVVPAEEECVTHTVTSDVQSWVDGAMNYGWSVVDRDETSMGSSTEYATKEGLDADIQPTLAISYDP